MQKPTSLDTYRLLGRSGLRVSPLALGAMTFGERGSWGADETESRLIFDAYVDRGGNFIDTANNYSGGQSEKLVGKFSREKRQSLVIATKYSLMTSSRDPNAGGNHRKNLVQSLENSLRRLQMDYVDILYLHMWDFTTPVDEIMRALDDLVRSGKVLYLGLSDTPAWQAARMQTMADLRGWTPITVLQIAYSLIERSGERDLLPMAREMGMGVLAWSALGMGVLTGKYSKADLPKNGSSPAAAGVARKDIAAATGSLNAVALDIAEEVKSIATEIGASPAHVALAWVLSNPAMTAPIVGARTLAQLENNLGALEIALTDAHLARLEAVSGIDLGFPHELLRKPMTDTLLFGALGRINREA